MKIEDYKNIRFAVHILPPLFFFAGYFSTIALPISAAWHIYLMKSRTCLNLSTTVILFSFFISITGTAIDKRDKICQTNLYTGTVQTPVIIECYKKKLEKITTRLKNSEFMTALTMGKRNFSSKFRINLVNTGTMHIVAISAFHVGLSFIMMNFLLKLSGITLLLSPRFFTLFSLILKTIFSVFYFFITGASLPTLRALIFILFLDTYLLTGRNPHPFTIFLYSIMSVSIIIPNSVKSISFIMSALCVATVINIWKLLPKSVTVKLISTSIILNYILIPVSASLNGTYPLLSPLVNLFVIPVVSISLPFITVSQFIIPFSDTVAKLSLRIADFLISPAAFAVNFFGNTASKSLIPLIDPFFAVKIIFIASFFGALFFKKLKKSFIILNLIMLIPFHFNLKPENMITRPDNFYGRVLCVTEFSGKGHLIFDKFRHNPDIDINFVQRVERASSECGINYVVSLHLPENISGKENNLLKERLRLHSVKIYRFDKDPVNFEDHVYGSFCRDHDHIPSPQEILLQNF